MAYTFKHGDRPLEGLTVQRAVGRGGFGEVYYALTDSGKQIALKYLRDNPEVELRGISHTMNLKSPHLITIYDVRNNADREPFVVMEYVSGPSLLELMTAEPKGLGPQKAAFFLSGIAKGLSYLHERGIVHRDLKPGNIFYDDGYVKIGDYGLSKHMSVSRHSGNTVSVGTVHYMAPEIGSGNYTKAIDIYAMGVILYEMLTGRLPFTGSSMAEILMRHLQDRPDLGGISEPFASVISRALQKNPADRYQDVNEMVDAVLSAADVSASFRSFDPTSMSQAQRDPNAADAFRTMTTPPRPVAPPPLDVRGVMAEVAAGRIPPIPPIPPMPGETRAAFRAENDRVGEALQAPAAESKSNWPTLLTMALTVVAATTIISMVSRSRQDETPIAIGLFLIGGTIGVLLAHFQIILRNPLRNAFADRLMYAAGGFACALPGLAVASDAESHIARLIIPLVTVLGVCDMGKRIDAGRRGVIRGGWLWSPAILGLICAAAVNDGRAPWAGAGLGAGLALLVQLAAGMWPVRSRVQPGYPAWHNEPPPIPPAQPGVQGAARREDDSRVVTVDLRPPGVSRGQAFAGSIPLESVQHVGPRQTSPVVRLVAGVFSIVLIAVSLGCFFANLAIRVDDPRYPSNGTPTSFSQGSNEWRMAMYRASEARDVKGGLIFGTLAPLAALVFVGRKAMQREVQPIWRGTLRWLFASLGLMLTGGMIAILASQSLDNEERAATIFGLVVGAVGAIGCMAFAGPKAAANTAAPAPSVPPRSPDIANSVRDFMDQAMRTASESIQAATAGLKGKSEAPISAGGGAAILRPDVPSFAGRAGNAGMSFLGKLLLLGALTAAVISRAGPIEILERNGDGIVIGAGVVDFRDNGRTVLEAHLEPPVFIIPAIAGTLLLAFARRRDGGSHMARAFVAGGLMLAAAVLVSGPGAEEMTSIFQRRLSGGQVRMNAAPLVICGGMFLAGLTLLFWPRRRDENTIVI